MKKLLSVTIDDSFDLQDQYLFSEAPYVEALTFPDDTTPAYRSPIPSNISVPVNKPGNLDKHYMRTYHGEE